MICRILAGLFLVSTVASRGDVVVLNASADATLFESASGDLAGGGGDYLFAGSTVQNAVRRGLLQFDLSSLPSGATVTGVELTLTLSRSISGDHTISLYRALAGWSEGTTDPTGQEGGGAPAVEGDVTWVHRSYTNSTWTTTGGDFEAAASANASVGANLQAYTWSGSGMVADAQAWLADPASNFGWFLIGNEGASASAKRFNSRTTTETGTQPTLTVTYTVNPVPEPGVLFLAAAGLGQVLLSRRRRAVHHRF